MHPSSEPADFRILSIDGGGLKGAFSASFLATLEGLIGSPLFHHFDLITGTSTGGIIALGIALGIPAADILQFYRDEGPRIFPVRRRGLWARLRSLSRPKYDVSPLQQALVSVFGDRTLRDCHVPVIIPAFQVQQGKLTIFKTPHHGDYVHDHRYTAVEVARATSAAPYYLPTATAGDGLTFVDGGLAANNPTLLAVIEAMTTFQQPLRAINVLSIGCPGPLYDLPLAARGNVGGGGKEWVGAIIPAMFKAQDSLLEGCVKKLIASPRYVRRCIPTAHNRYHLDASEFHFELAGLGAADAASCFAQLRTQFFSGTTPHRPPQWQRVA